MSKILFKISNNKKGWEKFVSKHPQANFLQSYNWGLFNSRLNKKFFPICIFQNGEQIGSAMVIKEEAKRGDYLTLAGGPILDWNSSKIETIFNQFCHYLYQLAKNEDCHFVRVRPQVEDSELVRKLFNNNSFVKAPMHLTADLTLRLNIKQSEEKLLAQMSKSTRYEIRKAARLEIKTEIVKNNSFMSEFYEHQLYLAKKHNFIPFDYTFLLEQFKQFAVDDQVAFVNSYHENDLLASAFVIFYHQEAVYHYGVSTEKNLKLPGSYAVQWAAIKEAKKRGCSIYNFWGVSPKDEPKHRFAGPSVFKRGFGGHEVQHLPAHDLPTSSWYQLIKLFESLRSKTRGL